MSITVLERAEVRDPEMLRIAAGAHRRLAGNAPSPAAPAAGRRADDGAATHHAFATATALVAAALLVVAAVMHAANASADDGPDARAASCPPVTYTVAAGGAPPGAVADVHAAFAKVADTTGIRFSATGAETNPDVRVEWTAATSLREFASDARVAGFASPHAHARERAGAAIAGTVHLRAGQSLGTGFGPRTWGSLVLHELGHLLGLGHSDDATDVMFPNMAGAPASWSPAEAAELRTAAARIGCGR